MRTIIIILFISIFCACGNSNHPKQSVEFITTAGQQDSIFANLSAVTQHTIPEASLNDSLAFLILPIQASCPSCRSKTIDSIIKYEKNLPVRHYIIISAMGGRKTMNGFFLEQGSKIPDMEGQLFLDSINLAYKLDLYKNKPTVYYTFKRKAFKKVAARPSTVREDLMEFFSGYRNKG